MGNILWAARLYFAFALAVYMIGGVYIDSLCLAGHRDPLLELIPVVDVNDMATCGLVFLYIVAFLYLRPFIGTAKEAEFLTIMASVLVVRTVLCLMAGFGPPNLW